jgi:hypothetical protein
MIKLTDELYVAASQISKIAIRPHSEHVTVTLSDGECISVPPDYKKSKFDKQEQLVAEVRAAAYIGKVTKAGD